MPAPSIEQLGLSFGEDVLAVWLTWMATAHPLPRPSSLPYSSALSAFLLYHLFRFARRGSSAPARFLIFVLAFDGSERPFWTS